jgi:hypothetical protein
MVARTWSRSARPGLGVLVVLVVMVAVALALLVSVPALALPEGRVYELVSPIFKGGYGVAGPVQAVALDGESAAFESQGAFAGTDSNVLDKTYLARRGPTGWVTSPLQPPAELAPTSGVFDFSPTLQSVLASSFLGANTGIGDFHSDDNDFLLHDTSTPDTSADWAVFGGFLLEALDGNPPAVQEAGASADFCHLVFESSAVLLPAAINTENQLYELSAGCGGEPAFRLLGLNNSGGLIEPKCVQLGAGNIGASSASGAVSADGSEIFFTVKTQRTEKGCKGSSSQLFVRLGGSRTVEVSRPLAPCDPKGSVEGEVPCEGAAARPFAEFAGASRDGSRVFFTTTASLVGEDTDASNDLYMASIGCPGGGDECEPAQREVTSLVQVSHAPGVGEMADVQGVLRVASDGSRVYFVARGVLGEGANAEGQTPVKGADNLYVYDALSGRTVFIADLCSGPALSGVAEDLRCPRDLNGEGTSRNDTSLWLETKEVQSTSDGGFLVFSSYGRLIAHGAQADTDDARDVYRYDASTGALDRVSLGEAGHDANGNGAEPSLGAFDAHITGAGLTVARVVDQEELGGRAIDGDGSRIVFTSAEPLSPDAVNGLINVYEWRKEPGWPEGRVSLISSGTAETSDESPVITPSGRDVFFTTSAGLVPEDTDGKADVYDARLGGGFPSAPTSVRECSGDACQGSLTNPAPLLVPGSVSQASGENFAAVSSPVVKAKAKAKPKQKAKAKKKKRKKKGGASGTARGSGKSGGRSGR